MGLLFDLKMHFKNIEPKADFKMKIKKFYLKVQIDLFCNQHRNAAVLSIDFSAQCHKSQEKASQSTGPNQRFERMLWLQLNRIF